MRLSPPCREIDPQQEALVAVLAWRSIQKMKDVQGKEGIWARMKLPEVEDRLERAADALALDVGGQPAGPMSRAVPGRGARPGLALPGAAAPAAATGRGIGRLIRMLISSFRAMAMAAAEQTAPAAAGGTAPGAAPAASPSNEPAAAPSPGAAAS